MSDEYGGYIFFNQKIFHKSDLNYFVYVAFRMFKIEFWYRCNEFCNNNVIT